MKEFIIKWCIENISYSWHKTGEQIVSPTFVAGPIQNSSWVLQLFPRGESLGDYLSLNLQRGEDEGPSDLEIYFEFSFITAAGKPYAIKEFFKSFAKGTSFGHPRVMGRHEVFFQRKDLYLPQDILTLCCRIWTGDDVVKECEKSFGRTRLGIERISSIESIGPYTNDKFINILSKLQNEELMIIQVIYLEHKAIINIIPTNCDHLKFSTFKLSFVDKSNKNVLNKRVSVWLGPPRPESWRMPFQKKEDTSEDVGSTENNIELVSEFVYSTGEETTNLENSYPCSSRLSELVSKYVMSSIPGGNLSDCPEISQNLWNLHSEHVLCDVKLKTETTSFFVHKIVLCARSPVFFAMLTNEMREKNTNYIYIEDITDSIVEKFLHFLYTDNFKDLEWEAVIGLYYAADKYQVERLKILCCSYLLKNVDAASACELLMLADRHQDFYFKTRVEDFILKNDQRIFSSSIWKEFANEQSLLSAATLLLRDDKERGTQKSFEVCDQRLFSQSDVMEDFKTLYQGQFFSDIAIKTRSSTFPAHKVVLFAGSCTLREIFTKDLRDKSTECFEIEDLEDDIVSRMLLFLYTDSLEDVQWGTAMKLYRAAVIYQIQRLKIKCSCFLLENVDISNASDLLLLAHEHHDAILKTVVDDFIFMHSKEIFGSIQWADFSEANFRLANETMCALFRK